MFAEDKQRGEAHLKLLYKVLVYRRLDTRLCVCLYKNTAGLLMLWWTEAQPEKKNIVLEDKHGPSSPITATRGNFTHWQLQMIARANGGNGTETFNTEKV